MLFSLFKCILAGNIRYKHIKTRKFPFFCPDFNTFSRFLTSDFFSAKQFTDIFFSFYANLKMAKKTQCPNVN